MALTTRALVWGTAALLGAAVAAAQAPPISPTPAPATPPGAAAVAPAAASPAAPPGPTEKIVGIRVVGYQTVSPDTIAHYLGIKVGDTYDPDRIRGNFQSLWDV